MKRTKRMIAKRPQTVEEYLSQFPVPVRQKLAIIRGLIFELVPQATEKIGYGMPSYKLNGRQFLYYAAFSKHIGFYAYPNVYIEFKEELKNYKTGKGSVQFPLEEELPIELLKKMIQFRAEEMTQK